MEGVAVPENGLAPFEVNYLLAGDVGVTRLEETLTFIVRTIALVAGGYQLEALVVYEG